MKRILSATLALLFAASFAAADTWTGWVTDSHCGKSKARAGVTAEQVEMCVKGMNAKWQVWSEKDEKGYNVDDPSKVRPFTGKKVKVTGTLDAKTNTIKVESVETVAQK